MENKTKYSVVYKTPETTSTWNYDLSKFRNGPVSVEIEYHDGLVERKIKKPKTEKTVKTKKAKPVKKAAAKKAVKKVVKTVRKK